MPDPLLPIARLIPARLTLAACLLVLSAVVQSAWLSDEAAIMGTAIRVELWHDDAAAGSAAIAAVFDEMRRIDALWSPYKPDSELSRVNRDAAQQAVEVSAELIELLAQARAMSERTQGAFDITYASVGYLYDYRHQQRPDDTTVANLLPAIDYRHVIADPERRTVRFTQAGVRIDLGGIAKGYAVDRCIELLRARGIVHATVSAGGDSRMIGSRNVDATAQTQARPWMVGVRDPRRDGEFAAVIPLLDSAVSTSGDYERYFDADGKRFHHIIDPDTGRSANGVRSATIIGPDATTTDALSTSVFVLGVQKGMALIDGMQGFEAIVVDAEGRLLYSRGLEPPRKQAAHK